MEIHTTFLGAHAVPKGVTQAEYVRQVIQEQLPLVVSQDAAEFCDVFCDEGYFTNAETREILLAAAKAGLKLRMHADELADTGGAALAVELGQMGLRCRNVDQSVLNLSGGNQQKVVLAKWLFAGPRVLILDEPTRGIDVGAKFEIYSLMAKLAAEGLCIVMISSELPELLGMSDRVYVMNEGRFVAELSAAEATQESVMRAIVNNKGLATAA